MVLSLAEELEVDPTLAILRQFQRNGGDFTEMLQAVEIMKRKEAKM